MMCKEYLLIDAEARSELLREEELSVLDHSPWEIDIHVTINGYNQSTCWKGPLLFRTSSVWVHGSKGTRTLKDRRMFRAQDLGQRHDAPTTDDDEEDYELFSKKHGNEAHEPHRREVALHDAWRDEEDLKLRELMQAKEWEPSSPPPLRRTVRARQPRPTPSSTHQIPLLYRASAGRLPRPRRTDGHPPALGRRTATSYIQPASPFHSRTPPLPLTALPFVHPPLSRESPGLTK